MQELEAILQNGGSFEDTNRPWSVSWWHVPNGSDYDMAIGLIAYFQTEVEANKAADDLGRYPERMPTVMKQ